MTEGIIRRLRRLQNPHGTYCMLAVDHCLSTGDKLRGGSIPDILSLANKEPKLGSVVLNYGMALKYATVIKPELVIQCFGLPSLGPKSRRVRVCGAECAASLDAAAVSIQIDMQAPDISQHVKEIMDFVCEAKRMGLPILFMATGFSHNSTKEVARVIRICQELGADLVKVRFSGFTEDASELTELLRNSVPVLLAGGEFDPNVVSSVRASRSVGFSGFCIGRSIFEAENSVEVINQLTSDLEST